MVKKRFIKENVDEKELLKFQQEKTEIEDKARETVDPVYADAIRRGIRANKLKEKTLKVEETPKREENPKLPKMRNGAKQMRLTLDESLFREFEEECDRNKKEIKETYKGQVDESEAEELVLYIRNDNELYDRNIRPTATNLARKLNKGIFDKELAAKAFLYVVDAGVRKYKKEFPVEDGYEQYEFNLATREYAAKELLEDEMELIEDIANDFKKKDNKVEENLSGTMTAEEIAKKHKVPVEEINKQVEKGIKVEKEHTDDEKKAKRIALDHLFEIPDYYDRLDKMEKGAKKVNEELEDKKVKFDGIVGLVRKPEDLEDIEKWGTQEEGVNYIIEKEIKTNEIKDIKELHEIVRKTKVEGGDNKDHTAVYVIKVVTPNKIYIIDPEGYDYARYVGIDGVYDKQYKKETDELLFDSLTETIEDKKVKFDYALIEFIEGGPSTDTPSEARLRKLKEEKRKFTDLDELGDLIFRADEDVKEFGEPGYDKLYVDFYGKADDGTDVKIHIYRADLGDGLKREDHLSNSDIPQIEEYLEKEYNKNK